MASASEEAKREYQEVLSRCRQEKLSDPIPNCYPWHTKLATLELLDLARETAQELRVLTGTATEQFYGPDILAAMENCLKAGCDARVLIWNDRESQACMQLKELQAKYPSQFDVWKAGTRRLGDEIPHFLLVGDRAYRLEAPHQYLDEGSVRMDDMTPPTAARICFNDSEQGGNLSGFFDAVWRDGSLSQSAAV